jgi:hypothetical protein
MSTVSQVRAWWRSGVLLFGLALSIFAARLQAQTTTGSVRGYVRDERGTVVADAQVTARNLAMGSTRIATSNEAGFYNLAGLRPGEYEVAIRRLGFTAQTRQVVVQIGQTLTADFALAQAAAQLAGVVVSATVADTKTSEIGTNVTRAQIENLPNFERNFMDFAKLAPGLTPSKVDDQSKTFSSGAQPAEAVNIFVDGASYKSDVLKGGVAGQDQSKGNPFPQGAVQEFRVVTQNYKAEYQKATSAIITATTRSGTNHWEGEAFAFGVNKELVKKDAFAARKNFSAPNYKRLQAGGSVGGPLVTNKLFLFGTYELNFRDEPQYVTLGGDSSLASAALRASLRQYTGQFTSQFREHLGFAKLTWEKSNRSTVDVSANLRHDTDFRGFGGQNSYQFAENFKVDVSNVVANWKYAGDRWLNEAQANGQHFVWNPTPLNTNLVVRQYDRLLTLGGRDGQQNFTQNRLSLRDDLTRSGIRFGGDHVFKGGINVDFLGYNASKDQVNSKFQLRATENFSRPYEARFGFGDPIVNKKNTQAGFYVQDDWSVSNKLVLNLGLRWDVETNMNNNDYVTPKAIRDSLSGPLRGRFLVDRPDVLQPDGTRKTVQVDVIGQNGGLDRFLTNGRSDRPVYLGAWQPRLGASYDVTGTGRTVLFGGAGIYYDRNYWNSMFDEFYRRQYHVLRVEFNDVGPTAGCPLCAQWNDRYYDPAQLRTLAGTAGVDEIFLVANDLKPPKSYQMSGGVRQQFRGSTITLSYNGVRGFNRFNYVKATNWGGLGPTYSQAFITDDRVKTWYNAVQFQIDRPMLQRSRFGGSLAYTFARSDSRGRIDDFFWDFDDHHPTVADMPRQRTPGNQAHTVVANGIARLPYDFLFSAIVNLGSGLTENGTDASRGFGFATETKYVYTPPARPFLGLGHVFNTQNADVRLQKDFFAPAGNDVSLILDLFNAFNSANFGCYATLIKPPGDPVNDINTPGCAALGRRLQIGLRYGLRPNREP